MKKIIGPFILIFVFLIFLARAVIFLDPDFGWHLKMGEIITTSGIPRTDPFSYTMPSFPFIDHEWLTNIATYQIYNIFGYLGLAVISTLLVFLTVAILVNISNQYRSVGIKKVFLKDFLYTKIGKNFLGPNFIILLTLAVLLPYFGVRAQVESWLLLSLLTIILFKEGVWAKGKYVIPAIILFWTNLHGSFAVGVSVLTAYLFIRTIRTRKIERGDLFILLLAILATFVNPYGIKLWGEVWMQASDGSLRWNITEWMPSIFMLDIAFVCLLSFSTFLVFKYKKYFKTEELLIYLAFLVQALLSRRHVPLWAVASYPTTVKTLYFFYDEIKNIKGAKIKFQKLYQYTWLLAFLILVIQSFMSLRSAQSIDEKAFYPKDAIAFLKEDIPEGKIFSEYAWGGYLIWKFPEKKVFIDGRMPSWRWYGNPQNESSSSFDEYIGIVDGKTDYKEAFGRYDIKVVLWPKEERGELLDVLAQKIALFITKGEGKEEKFNLLSQLEKDGWEKAYEDTVALVYKKQN